MTSPSFKATKDMYGMVRIDLEHAEGLPSVTCVDPGQEQHYRRIAEAILWFFDTKPEVIDPRVEGAKAVLAEAGYIVQRAKWDRLEDIPDGTPFTSDWFFNNEDFSSYYISNGDGTGVWEHNGVKAHAAGLWNSDGPFHAIPAEHLHGKS